MSGSIRLYRPPRQKQSKTNAKNQLLLFSQTVHGEQYSGSHLRRQAADVNETKNFGHHAQARLLNVAVSVLSHVATRFKRAQSA